MEIKVSRKGQRIHAMLVGELDHHSAIQVRTVLDRLLDDPAVMELALDLSGVSFMDSSGLGVVLGRYRVLASRGGKLLLNAVPLPIDKLFRMAGLYAIVERG